MSAGLPWGPDGAAVDELVELIRRPAWHEDAACREAPESVSWCPGRGVDTGPPKAVCQRCLVAGECLAWAVGQGPSLQGNWGGLSDRERRRLRQ